MKLVLVLWCSGCFYIPERHPIDHGGDDGGPGSDGVDANEGPGPHANIIFVTAGTFPIDLGLGIMGPQRVDEATAFCQNAAYQAPMTSPVRGHYFKAWLSCENHDVVDALRLASARAWKRVDGAPIASTVTELTSGTLRSAPDVDETGQQVGPLVQAWTGTSVDGTHDVALDADCSAGNLEIGYPTKSDSRWTVGDYVQCATMNVRLYCVGYDIQDGQL